MPAKFAKALGGTKGVKEQDLDLQETPAPKGKRKAAAGKNKNAAAAAAEAAVQEGETPLKRPSGGEAAADEPSTKKTRARKPKPEGPYTCFKEQGCIPEPSLPRRPADDLQGRRRLGLLSWNVGGLRAFLKSKVADLQEAVKQAEPDVLGIVEHKLQESGSDTEAALNALLEALPDYKMGAVSYSTAKKGYSGTLVLLRKTFEEPIKVSAEDLPSAANEGRLVVTEFQALFVVQCYVPNSGDGLKRLSERIEQWDLQLRDRLKALAQQKAVVLIGDLNVAHQDKDIWNVEAPHIPKSAGTTPQERESFSKLLESGFKDGFALRHPEALGAFTYWSVRAGNRKSNRGLRLDYVLVSEGMAAESAVEGPVLLDTFHLPALAQGDHCPVGAVIGV